MITIKVTCVIYTLTLTVLAAGCSSGTSTNKANPAPHSQTAGSSGRSTQKIDACNLLTKEDVESFLAEPVGTPAITHIEAMGNTVTQCRYSAPSGNKRVGLLLRQAATVDEAAKIFRQARDTSKELSDAELQVIDGLGENAYWTGGNLKQLNVLKGDTWLIVTASTGNGTDPLEASKSVSRKILARMP